jgi:Flp pilus assembly protein TadG
MTGRRGPRRRRNREGGQATVELALLLPVVVVLLLVILQVGLIARDLVLVSHAAREAARAAAVDSAPGAAREAATHAGGLDPSRVSVTTFGRRGTGSRVRVVVRYQAATNVPFVGAFVGDRTLRAEATMRVEGP